MFFGIRFRLVRVLVASAAMAISAASAQMQIGSLDASGGLSREIALANSSLGPISLSHQTNPKGRGSYSVVSEWKVPALFTFAGPDGRKDTVWVRPGGQAERFSNKDIEKRKPDDLIEAWTAVSDGAQGDCTFFGRDGSIYVYELYSYAPGGQKASVRFIKLVNGQSLADANTSYQYDHLGRVTEVQLNNQPQVVYRYMPNQLKVAEKWYTNGIHHRYSYDKEGRPLSVSAFNEAKELVRGIAYEWNDQGLLVGRTMLTGQEEAAEGHQVNAN